MTGSRSLSFSLSRAPELRGWSGPRPEPLEFASLVVLEGDGPRRVEKRPFSFTLSAQDAEDIRWYLEDYRIYSVDPQPKQARRIAERMDEETGFPFVP